MYICVYIYIYVERERERDREIYIYMYSYYTSSIDDLEVRADDADRQGQHAETSEGRGVANSPKTARL